MAHPHLIRLPLSHSGSSVNSQMSTPMSTHQHHLGSGPTSYFSPPNSSSASQFMQRSPPSGGPISPPRTRSASAESSNAQIIENYRKYSQNLREQHEGEIAHIAADRERAKEVMAEERELWATERRYLVARIRHLESRLASHGELVSPTGILNLDLGDLGFVPTAENVLTSPVGLPFIRGPEKVNGSPAGGISGSKKPSHGHAEIKQESGRNADGTPFYAPAPQNPIRTFSTELESMRVEDIHAPTQTPIQVIQELTPSDFFGSSQRTSPDCSGPHHSAVHWEEDESIKGSIIGGDSIDISRIAPHLEGVPIKASAVDPIFVANVLSPRSASPVSSTSSKPAGRDVGSSLGDLEKVHLEPENKRLTMYAGHTPNHSISSFSDLVKEDGDETPRGFDRLVHRGSLAPVPDGDEILELRRLQPDEYDEEVHDRPLKGPLGLTNVTARDELFLEALTEKLEEVKNSRPGSAGSEETSPSVASSPFWSNGIGGDGDSERGIGGEESQCTYEGDDEVSVEPMEVELKLKPSMNFGKPMGFR
ncbi:hypothetical protein DSL72_009389 [Monilinia vaccinii-corymbosi]|uniref:Uncharacterized protein n=1 Tax=Monilinia vaccinii-corymbosi TaxID=61207 RepID=A0A8A3PQZ8_9HELO|nr:hypothetical protein DSL72_009389 [Monilinia vaccinii-corymbosi]